MYYMILTGQAMIHVVSSMEEVAWVAGPPYGPGELPPPHHKQSPNLGPGDHVGDPVLGRSGTPHLDVAPEGIRTSWAEGSAKVCGHWGKVYSRTH